MDSPSSAPLHDRGFENPAPGFSNIMQALGSRPPPSLVRQSHLAIAQIEADLSLRLAFLPSIINTTSSQWPLRQERVEDEEKKLREEAERAKQPHKAIISLSELHQIYESLLENQEEKQTMKTLQLLGSFSELSTTAYTMEDQAQQDVAQLLLEVAHNHKTKLDLSGRLLDRLPSSFGQNLSTLVSLDLSKNQLKDLPRSIEDLDNLEVLDVHSNQLSKLPDTIGFLNRLRTLNVSGNMLMALPDSIGGCRLLVELNAGFNQLERLPLRIGHDLISLENLSLHSNKLTFLPPSICHLRRLKVLDLHFNKLKSLPLAIGNLRALQKLNLSNNFSDFGGDLPDSIGDLACLIELDLSSNQVRVLPDSIGALPNIKLIKVENNPLIIPPLEVVEHSVEAMLEYMGERWKASQDFEENVGHTRSSRMRLSRSTSSCVRNSGSWLVGLLGGKCTGRHPSVYYPKSALDDWPNRSNSVHDRLVQK